MELPQDTNYPLSAEKSVNSPQAAEESPKASKASPKPAKESLTTTDESSKASEETSEGSHIGLTDLVSHRFGPVKDSIVSNLPISDLGRLSRTTGSFSDLQNHALRGLGRNYNKFLGNFFKDPVAFRSLQAKWNALLTGHVYLDFLSQSVHFLDANPLLIIVLPGTGRGHLIEAIKYLQEEGYAQVSVESGDDPWGNDGTCCQYRHTGRVTSNKGKNPSVLLKHTLGYPSPPITEIILSQKHTITTIFNFASWNKVYSLFPAWTFLKKEGYLCTLSSLATARMSLLSAAGYKTKDVPWFEKSIEMLTRLRRVGDKHTWVLPLPIDGVTRSSIPDAVLEFVTFRFEKVASPWPIPFYRVFGETSTSLHFPILRHQVFYWLGTEAKGEYQNSIKYLESRLASLSVMELQKIPETERPAICRTYTWNQMLKPGFFADHWTSRRNEEWKPPSLWTYYDEDVLEYLAKVEADREKAEEDASSEPAPKKRKIG